MIAVNDAELGNYIFMMFDFSSRMIVECESLDLFNKASLPEEID